MKAISEMTVSELRYAVEKLDEAIARWDRDLATPGHVFHLALRRRDDMVRELNSRPYEFVGMHADGMAEYAG